MKKLQGILILILLSTSFALGQVELVKDSAAKNILDAVSKKVSKSKGIKIKFNYTVNNKQNGYKETQKAYVFMEGQKFKAIIPQFEIISDGKSVWTYSKEDEEVTITDVDTSEISIFNPMKLFTAYKTGYKYLLIGVEKIDNKEYNVIDLYPEDTENSPYAIIRIKTNKATNEIYSLKTSGKSGVNYTFEIVEYKSNLTFPDKLFVFDKSKYPDNIEITDMR